MKTFHCNSCSHLVFFENVRCERCESLLGYVPELREISAFEDAGELYLVFERITGRPLSDVIGERGTLPPSEALEVARDESCRLTWKPYMHDPSLPYLLRRKMPPTLVVWGREDAIVPVNAGEIYQESIRGSRLVVLDGCGHRPEIEQRERFVRLVEDFLQET